MWWKEWTAMEPGRERKQRRVEQGTGGGLALGGNVWGVC